MPHPLLRIFPPHAREDAEGRLHISHFIDEPCYCQEEGSTIF